jgi:hypothetical protein
MFRRAHLIAVLALCGLLSAPLHVHAATPEEQAVLAPLQKLFEGMAKHDKEAVREQLLPGGMVTLKRKEDQIIQMHFDVFVEHIGGTNRI